MFWMKRHHGKSWHTLYKEVLLKLQEVNLHLRTLQQKYINAKEQIIDLNACHKQQLENERTEHTKAILSMRLLHEEQLREIRVELRALQIELQRVKVKDEIAHTKEALITQCLRILGDYLHGKEPGDKEGAVIGTALDALKSSYRTDHALRRQAVDNAVRRVGYPGTATDMNRAMYGLGGSGVPGHQPTGDPQNKVNIGQVYGPGVKLDKSQEEAEQPLASADLAPENTRPDPKGT